MGTVATSEVYKVFATIYNAVLCQIQLISRTFNIGLSLTQCTQFSCSIISQLTNNYSHVFFIDCSSTFAFPITDYPFGFKRRFINGFYSWWRNHLWVASRDWSNDCFCQTNMVDMELFRSVSQKQTNQPPTRGQFLISK